MTFHRHVGFAFGAAALSLVACSKGSGDGSAPAASAASTGTAAAATTAAAPPAAAASPAITCSALITHVLALEDAEKKDGIINHKNADSMTARCEKANNVKDVPDVAKCVLGADKVATMSSCKDLGKLLGPW
jgi:hypothetical protein